jgi:hypothetical protein
MIKLTREHGVEIPSSDLKILSGNCHTVAGDWRGRGLVGVVTWSDQSGKTWL